VLCRIGNCELPGFHFCLEHIPGLLDDVQLCPQPWRSSTTLLYASCRFSRVIMAHTLVRAIGPHGCSDSRSGGPFHESVPTLSWQAARVAAKRLADFSRPCLIIYRDTIPARCILLYSVLSYHRAAGQAAVADVMCVQASRITLSDRKNKI